MFSLSEISLWKMSSISINRYVLIVHPDYFYTIFSVRNSRIIVAFVWPFARHLTRPIQVSELQFCLTAIITIVPISLLCYLAIINKVRSSNSRINVLQLENSDRMKNHRQLIRTMLVIISIFMIMNTPFIGTLLLDPNQEKFQLLDSLCVALSWIIQLFNKHPYPQSDE